MVFLVCNQLGYGGHGHPLYGVMRYDVVGMTVC